MKKSIGILAAVLLSASAYSQPYSGPDRGLTGNPEGDNLRSRQFESGAPAVGGFEATQSESNSSSLDQRQNNNSSSSSTYNSEQTPDQSSSSDQNNGLSTERFDSSVGTSSTSSSDSSATLEQQETNPQVKQGLSLDDKDAADVLRQSDDPDLANRNNQRRAEEQGLAQQGDLNSDFSQRKGSEQDPDMVYEEWYIFGPFENNSDQAVGGPAESESGSSSSKAIENKGSSGELDNKDPQSKFDSDVQESGELNASRTYNGTDYWRDNSGAPGNSQSESDASRHECDTDKDKGQGSPGESEHGSRSYHDDDDEFNTGVKDIDNGIKDDDQTYSDTDRAQKGTDLSKQDREPKPDANQGSSATSDSGKSKATDDYSSSGKSSDDSSSSTPRSDDPSFRSDRSLQHSDNRDYPEAVTTTPDL